jgi:hypothetical protein
VHGSQTRTPGGAGDRGSVLLGNAEVLVGVGGESGERKRERVTCVGHLTSLSEPSPTHADRTARKRVLGKLISIQALFSIWVN